MKILKAIEDKPVKNPASNVPTTDQVESRDQKFLYLIVDDRERKLAQLLREYPVEIIVQRLDVGDILVSSDLAVERKRGDDLVSSILDNRLWDELERLTTVFPTPVLVIEDLARGFVRGNVKPASVYGALNYVATRYKVPIIPTRNTGETALLLYRMVIREQERDKSPAQARKAPKMLSHSMRKEFFLEGFYNTGPEKARVLIDHFKSISRVVDALRSSKIEFTPSGRPKLDPASPFARLKGFGPKWVEKNRQLIQK